MGFRFWARGMRLSRLRFFGVEITSRSFGFRDYLKETTSRRVSGFTIASETVSGLEITSRSFSYLGSGAQVKAETAMKPFTDYPETLHLKP